MKQGASTDLLSGFIVAISLALLFFVPSCASEAVQEPVGIPIFGSKPDQNSELASGLNYVVADTGQSKCYNDAREIPCPQQGSPFYGQDAQHRGNQPFYRDNGNGTVTDLNTGLMWQRTPGEKMTFAEAAAGAKNFNLAGHSDWRLPSIKELYSLILFSGTDPPPQSVAINAVPFINTAFFDFEYGNTGAGERMINAQ